MMFAKSSSEDGEMTPEVSDLRANICPLRTQTNLQLVSLFFVVALPRSFFRFRTQTFVNVEKCMGGEANLSAV